MRLHRSYASCVLLICCAILMPTGCEKDKANKPDTRSKTTKGKKRKAVLPAPTQDTPQGTIRKYAAAFRAKKLNDYLATIQYAPFQKPYVVTMFRMNATCDLQRALEKTFDEDAWANLQGVDVSPEFGASFTYTVPPPGDQWQEDMKIEIDGDRATWICTWGRRPERHELVFDKKRKAWLLLLPGTPKDEPSVKSMCALVDKLTQAARAGTKAASEPDITVREIKLRMGDDFFQRPRMEVEPEPEKKPEPDLVPEAEPNLEKEAGLGKKPVTKTGEPKKVPGTKTEESE